MPQPSTHLIIGFTPTKPSSCGAKNNTCKNDVNSDHVKPKFPLEETTRTDSRDIESSIPFAWMADGDPQDSIWGYRG